MFWPLANSSRFIEITSPVPRESTFEALPSSSFKNMNMVKITFFEQIEFVNLENESKSWVSFNVSYGFIWV